MTENRIIEGLEKVLSENYRLGSFSLKNLPGGYRSNENFLVHTSEESMFVVKSIVFDRPIEDLNLILSFENFLKKSFNFPCPEIIATVDDKLFVSSNDGRILFVQQYLRGSSVRQILEADENSTALEQMAQLLVQFRLAFRCFMKIEQKKIQHRELDDVWWENVAAKTNDPFLLENLDFCRKSLIEKVNLCEQGLIHNDFHLENSIVVADQTVFIIDLIDGCHSVFVSDLATSLFHLFVDQNHGVDRARRFYCSYLQNFELKQIEIELLPILIQLKLTESIIVDLENSDNVFNDFLHRCYRFLRILNDENNFLPLFCQEPNSESSILIKFKDFGF